MDSDMNNYFDLTLFLKQGTLCLREIADEYTHPVDEYFQKLSDFLDQSLDVKIALNAFAMRKGDKEAYKSLDNMATLLKELKCVKLVTDFYSILGAYENGNWKMAAFIAQNILKPFDEFTQSIAAAKKAKKPVNAPDTTLSLKDFIKRLDEEEANRKMVILAVDDSPSILTSLSFVLSKDYKAFTLVKPTELEKVLKKLTPDLFLLDYEMPELNGFELVPIIRGFEEHKDTPIIYLTSIGTIDIVTSALALGACDFIVKPFNPDILLEKVGKWIVRKKSF